MATKLDLGQVWSDATALVMGNRDTVLVVAGVFFFLPNLAANLLMPQAEQITSVQMRTAGEPADFGEAMAMAMAPMNELMASYWWVFILLAIAQVMGVISLLSLLTDRARPTVGDALAFGLKSLPTYLATQIIMGLAFGLLMVLLLVIGAEISVPLAIVLAFPLLIGMVYASVKLTLVSPVIAIEKQLNPFAAIQRSWTLSKGNSLLIFAYFLLLTVVMLVLSMVIGLFLMVFTLLSAELGLIVNGVVNAAINMVMVIIFLGALAAMHRQLAGSSGAMVGETFD